MLAERIKASNAGKKGRQPTTVATKRSRDFQPFPKPPSKVQKIQGDDKKYADKQYAAFVRHIKTENVDLDFTNKHFVDDDGKQQGTGRYLANVLQRHKYQTTYSKPKLDLNSNLNFKNQIRREHVNNICY